MFHGHFELTSLRLEPTRCYNCFLPGLSCFTLLLPVRWPAASNVFLSVRCWKNEFGLLDAGFQRGGKSQNGRKDIR